jgi:hypothetical protein
MTVVHYEAPAPLPPSRPGDELEAGPVGDVARLRAAAELAAYIAGTEFVPDQLRNRPEAITAALLAGAELGLERMASLRSIAIIKGRPTLSAEAQRGLVIAKGHELWFEESTVTRAIAAGRRAGEDRIGRVTWTLDDAKRAGLAGQQNWRAYPAEMLRARASAALARAMFPDVTLGIPATEELDDDLANGAPGIPPTPPPDNAPPPAPATRTRRRSSSTPAERPPVPPTPPPDQQPEPEVPPEPPATDAAKRKIFALMRDVGIPAGDRDRRLAYTRRIVERDLASSAELTIGEADRVIVDLERILALPADQRPAAIAGPSEQEDGGVATSTPTPKPAEHDNRLEQLDELVTAGLEHGLTIHDLYTQIAEFRHVLTDNLVAELGGADTTGRLLWSPLRNSLRPDEITDLFPHLVAAKAAATGDDIPF